MQAQVQRCTCRCKGENMEVLRCRGVAGAEMQRCRGGGAEMLMVAGAAGAGAGAEIGDRRSEMQRCRDAEMQKYRNAEVQMCRGTEVQR